MNVFISGGCKNGKSTYAEKIAVALSKKANPLYYIATMNPLDSEDDDRIAKHRKSREGFGFNTVECQKDIVNIATICNITGTFLLDSLTALLANEMFPSSGKINLQAHNEISDELTTVLRSVGNMVIVSDCIYSNSEFYDEYTENYIKGLTHIDCQCASLCDVVIEVCYNNLIFYKGKNLLEGIYDVSI